MLSNYTCVNVKCKNTKPVGESLPFGPLVTVHFWAQNVFGESFWGKMIALVFGSIFDPNFDQKWLRIGH